MSTAQKKLPATGRDSTTQSSSPSRNPSRMSAASNASPSVGSNSGLNRTRSTRAGTPVSARASAARRDSPLSSASGDPGSEATEREEALRAENIAVIDDLKERLAHAEASSEQYKRQTEVLESRLDESQNEQAKLEERVHEKEGQIELLRNERRDATRQIREMETIYEAERSSMTREKEDMANREEEMQMVIQRLKDSLAQRNANGDEEVRPSRHSNNSPSLEGGGFAPPASLHRSDSRNNSKLILQKDKLIESLRLELAEAQIKLVESENQGGGRLQEVERLLMEARMANARLMEDNESYQLLLQERTLNGDFSKTDFSYMGSGGMPANQDALNALEGRSSAPSLADELSEAGEAESENYRRLEAELRSMKEQNKALTLYINKIIERLLQHQEFEHILEGASDAKMVDTNKELPPPPSDKPATATSSLLQRAKSMAQGAARPKARPMSYMPSAAGATAASTAHNNPDTAPSIPIGLTRNTSVRRNRPMSEQFAGGAAAANVVNAMYKGPDGPLTPNLRSQTGFGGSILAQGSRTPSGPPAPASSGNFPGMRSETSSTSDDSGGDGVSTPPSQQSPPRAAARDGPEKATTFAGNKPRPLRLVQENPDMARAADKRSSWMGWAFSAAAGVAKKEDIPPIGPGESIRE